MPWRCCWLGSFPKCSPATTCKGHLHEVALPFYCDRLRMHQCNGLVSWLSDYNRSLPTEACSYWRHARHRQSPGGHACEILVLALSRALYSLKRVSELEGAQRVSQSTSKAPLCSASYPSSRTSLPLCYIIRRRAFIMRAVQDTSGRFVSFKRVCTPRQDHIAVEDLGQSPPSESALSLKRLLRHAGED